MTPQMTPQRILRRVSPVGAALAPVLVVTAPALAHPLVELHVAAGGRLIVAGDDPIRMSLAGVLFPQAQRIWANLGSSAQVNALAAQVGACDGLLHAVPMQGDAARETCARETMVAIGLILAFLPALSAKAKVHVVGAAPSMRASLTTLSQHLGSANRLMPQFCFEDEADKDAALSGANFVHADGNPMARAALI